MKKKHSFIFWLFISISFLKAQLTNPLVISFPPVSNPSLTVNNYTRAAQSIHLQCNNTNGFQFGLISPNSSGMLNLSIGPYPTFVNSAYLGSAINPNGFDCGVVPSIDVAKPVAELAGQFEVSPTGAATYNIPIEMSPGTKGIQPSLSLSYNSQSGIGLLGVGWNLIGLSSISRTNKTPMHDGNFAGIRLNSTDVFSLNGNRLFALNGVYGQHNTTYYTEEESFSTITSINNNGSGPEKFEVIDKNGNTIEYGFTVDSRLIATGSGSVLTWYINKLTDEFGNYLKYSYKQLSGEIVIDKIEYTGNVSSSMATYNKINFEYIPLAESNTSYINGNEFKQSQLLKAVCCWAGNSLFKKYILEYEWKEGTYLRAIKEINSDGTELNPTLFCWDDPNDFSGIKVSSQNLNTNFVPSDYINLITVPADLNADGFSDFVCYNTNTGRLRVYENTFESNYGSSNNSIGFINKIDNPNQMSPSEVVLSSNICDENHDGKQEVFSIVSPILASSFGNNYSSQYYILKTAYNASNNVIVNNLGTYTTNSVFEIDASPPQFFFNVQDYTGDGLSDILKIDNESIMLNASSNTYTYPLYSVIKTFARPFNFDPDGVSEYLIVSDYGTSLNFNTIRFSGNTLYALTYGNFNINFPNNGTTQKNLLQHISYGDLNGDGIDDIVYIKEDNSEMYVIYGTGTTFSAPKKISAFTPLGTSNKFDLSCVDLNADGKMDIIINENDNSNNTTIYYSYLSFGDIILKGGSYQGNWKIGAATKIFYDTKRKGLKNIVLEKEQSINVNTGLDIHYADFNGDGIYDYTNFNPGSDQIITNKVNGEVRQMITKIYTPFRNNIEIRYANIGNRYNIDNNNNKEEILKPIINAGFNNGIGRILTNMYCVSHIFKSSGYSGQFKSTTRYSYANPTFHQFGRGFLGFQEINSINLTTNIGTQITNSFYPSFFVTIPETEIICKYNLQTILPNTLIFNPDYSKIISKNRKDVNLVQVNPSSYFMQLIKSENTDFLNSTKQSTEFTYDMQAKGSIQTQITKYGWNLNSPIKSTISNFSYIQNHGNFKLWKENVQSTQTGQPSYDRDVEFFYDNSGHLISKINDQNTPGLSSNVLTTNFSQFTPFGDPTKISISAPDVSPRTSEMLYDIKGRFVVKKTNALGNYSSFTYEPIFGNLIQSTDINGLTTKYEYDNLGRLIKTSFPNNIISKQKYIWENPSNYNYCNQPIGAYSILTETDAKPYSKVYYTGNGLKLRNETQDFVGNTIVTDHAYNYTNTLIPESVLLESTSPHYTNQNKFLKTSFEYEATYYRPSITKSFSVNAGTSTFTGFYIQTNYNIPSTPSIYHPSFIETENQLGQKEKKIFNAAGQVTLVSNSNLNQQQDLIYNYDSNGQPNEIKLSSPANSSQNIDHTFVYNNLGQKIKSIDPSHGIQDYVYNTIGELLQESNSNGNFVYTYDNLGRVLTKAGSQSGNFNYQYITSGPGKEQIWKISGPNNITEYQYDAVNRLIQTKETINQGNKVFQSNFTYDNYGRESQHTYPSGYNTITNYNSLGFITSISNNANQTLWQLKNMDALGRITEFDYGNGITTKNKFNDLNQLEEIEHGNIHKQNFIYDAATGNLIWRRFRNLINSTDLQEYFNYDDNDRLVNSSQYLPNNNTFPFINDIHYDILGNIIHKDDVGDYHYTNSNNPFQLTQVTFTNNNISLNTLSLSHTDFDKAKQISEMGTNKQLDFLYGNDEERLKVVYNMNGTNQYTRYYLENYDRQETTSSYKEWTYIFAPSGLCAAFYNNNGIKKLLYTNTDHLGSPVILTSTIGNNPQAIIEEYSFDAWGKRRNPSNWSYNNVPVNYSLIRGFTFHEQMDEFGLVNMNARIYDPNLGRMMQPDNFVQSPHYLQNYNRYAYAYNNPISNKDPDGNFIAAAASYYYLFATNSGYQLQKNYSPIALNGSANFGSNKRGLGIDASIGLPQILGPSYRVHGGLGYYWKNNDVSQGWEIRHGSEWAMGIGIGGMAYSTTHYNSPGTNFDQTTGTIRFFSATGNNLAYENDWQPEIFDKLPFMLNADHGDRLRTASMQLSAGKITTGFNLFTGDPGLIGANRQSAMINGRANYILNGEANPDEYRTGAAYIGYGPVKVGWNSEKVRHIIQNRFAHDFMQKGKVPWFKQLDIKPKFYYNLGSSGYGNGLY